MTPPRVGHADTKGTVMTPRLTAALLITAAVEAPIAGQA